jgi:hypothetical protein
MIGEEDTRQWFVELTDTVSRLCIVDSLTLLMMTKLNGDTESERMLDMVK